MRINPTKSAALLAGAVVLTLAPPSDARVTEQWQTRVLQAVKQMEKVDSQFSGERQQLQADREGAHQRAQSMRGELSRAQREVEQRCGDAKTTDPDCLDAVEGAQGAHLQLTENVKHRLDADARLLRANVQWSVALSDVLVGVLDDLRKRDGKGEEVKGDPPNADAVARQAHAFTERALTALQSAEKYMAAVEVNVAQKAKARAARDIRVGIRKFQHDLRSTKFSDGPMQERLYKLQASMAAFAAINRQALSVIETNRDELRVVNALVATYLTEDLVAFYEGGLAKYGRKFIGEMEDSMHGYTDDIGSLMTALDGHRPDSAEADEGFFDEEEE